VGQEEGQQLGCESGKAEQALQQGEGGSEAAQVHVTIQLHGSGPAEVGKKASCVKASCVATEELLLEAQKVHQELRWVHAAS
jgi:hypothetical protein